MEGIEITNTLNLDLTKLIKANPKANVLIIQTSEEDVHEIEINQVEESREDKMETMKEVHDKGKPKKEPMGNVGTRKRLTPEQKEGIVQKIIDGKDIGEIAEEYGVSKPTIYGYKQQAKEIMEKEETNEDVDEDEDEEDHDEDFHGQG